MWWGIVFGLLIFLADSFMAVYILPTIFLAVLISIIMYKNKRGGLSLLITWSVLTDLLLYPQFPVTTFSVVLAFWLWRYFIDVKFNSTSSIYVMISGSIFVMIFMISKLIMMVPNQLIMGVDLFVRKDLLMFFTVNFMVNVFTLALLILIFRTLNHWRLLAHEKK